MERNCEAGIKGVPVSLLREKRKNHRNEWRSCGFFRENVTVQNHEQLRSVP